MVAWQAWKPMSWDLALPTGHHGLVARASAHEHVQLSTLPRRHYPVGSIPYLAALSAIAALGVAFFYYKSVEKESPGDERMVFLMTEIQKGAKAFLQAEYKWVSVFGAAMAVLLAVVIAPLAAVTYLLGAVLSSAAGYAGMTVATMANARTTEAAKQGPGKALPVAFRGGAVMGFSVAGLALLGLMTTYIVFVTLLEVDQAFEIVTAYGLGASTIALFSRVGGGIFTKAADVGADLVGKVEAGIPEDDPRNPATIADNVGDNVGDVAGMGADLFESYAGSIIAPISLIAFSTAGGLAAEQASDIGTIEFLVFPMLVAFIGMVASIIGSFLVKGGDSTDSKHLSKALHLGTNVAMGITAVGVLAGSFWIFGGDGKSDKPWGFAVSVIGGLVIGWALGKTAEYYTSKFDRAVKDIGKRSLPESGYHCPQGHQHRHAVSGSFRRTDSRRRRRRLLGRPAGTRQRNRWPVRHRHCRNRHARNNRHCRVGRCLRADCRQCRRYRRNGRA